MSFEIYFDESNKLDKQEGDYSYYGIIGWDNKTRKEFEDFMEKNKIVSEMHFADFNLNKVNNYLKALEFALEKIKSNFYIINKDEAFEIASKIEINGDMLRKLFYMKIPERLIYGMTRKIKDYKNIDIYIDKSEEYGNDENGTVCNDEFINKLERIMKSENKNKNKEIKAHIKKLLDHIQLPDTLKYQLNSQSLYRGLNYSINRVKQIESYKSKSLQVIDVLLGIIRFLYEEEYLNPSSSIKKDDMKEIMDNPLITEKDIEILKKCYRCETNKKGEERYDLIENISDNDKKNLIEVSKKVSMYSQKSIQRAEFIYRLLKNESNFKKLCNLHIFLWEKDEIIKGLNRDINKISKDVLRQDFSRYIAKFIKFKVAYDEENKLKIINLYKEKMLEKANIPALKESEYRKFLGFGGNLKKMVRRYLEDLKIDSIKE